MKFGLSEKEFLQLEQMTVSPLKERGAKVWIFGSRARGDHKEFSDVDVLYEFEGAAPQGLLFELKSNLEDSNFPFKLDLVK